MHNVPLDTKQVILGMLFPDNVLASTEIKKWKTGDAKYKTYANIITKSIITQSTMLHKHKNTITQNKHKLKPGLVASCDIWPETGAGLFLKVTDR